MLSKGSSVIYIRWIRQTRSLCDRKDGKMYYAFFTDPAKPFTGELSAWSKSRQRSDHALDDADGKDLGTVQAAEGQPVKSESQTSKNTCCWK